jgi:hypothetical protein
VTTTTGAPDGSGGYVLQGVVNPHNSPITDCHFEYGTTATYPNTYQAPCSPSAVGRNELQRVQIIANAGQFRLSFKGQTTGDLAFNASPATVQAALEGLSTIGDSGVSVATGPPVDNPFIPPAEARNIDVTFVGPLTTTNVAQLQVESGTVPLSGSIIGFAFASTVVEGDSSRPVTVEAHLEGLTVGAVYHFRLFATNAAGTVESVDREFTPTTKEREPCPANEALREENSSLALPECRAYEQVSPPNKAGFAALLSDYTDDGSSVSYATKAANIANSGQGTAKEFNSYVTRRTGAGWQTIPDLNGPNGSLAAPPYELLPESVPSAYSADLRSSLYFTELGGVSETEKRVYLRNPDGSFTLIGNGNNGPGAVGVQGSNYIGGPGNQGPNLLVGTSSDLSRVLLDGYGIGNFSGIIWGPGVYEFVGTGNAQPLRVDLDNTGAPISTCGPGQGNPDFGSEEGARHGSAVGDSFSSDGRVAVVTVAGGCGGANPPADQIWARIGGTTSIDASASQCTRPDCNAPAFADFQGIAEDGSRVYFTTTQQLVNGDTDETNDLYACDIPSGTPAPIIPANPCSSLHQVSSGDASGANVKTLTAFSKDGTSVYFVAQGVLAANEDALGEKAQVSDNNLYLWRADAAHPDGQTAFIGRLDSADFSRSQATPDGRYLVFSTASQLVSTDTDETRDVYRYDADTGELTRISTNVFGAAGNGEGFAAQIGAHAVSDDGSAIVFSSAEALSPLDGNGEPDAYLWKAGRVSLITTGSVGGDLRSEGGQALAIDGSGNDIFFSTAQQLTPGDGDSAIDVYDARVDGGFSFAQRESCAGETCQPESPEPLPIPRPAPPNPEGNPKLKHCPHGKVAKRNKCIKKPHKKHSGKKHHPKTHKPKKHNRAGSNSGGNK